MYKTACCLSVVATDVNTCTKQHAVYLLLLQMSIHVQNSMLYVFGVILNGSIWVFGTLSGGIIND